MANNSSFVCTRHKNWVAAFERIVENSIFKYFLVFLEQYLFINLGFIVGNIEMEIVLVFEIVLKLL